MIEFTKVYYLEKEWQPLIDLIAVSPIQNYELDITIYQLYAPNNKGVSYAVISRTKEIDEEVEKYGGELMDKTNATIYDLKSQDRSTLFGEKGNVFHLE
jgi:hypothetical protein